MHIYLAKKGSLKECSVFPGFFFWHISEMFEIYKTGDFLNPRGDNFVLQHTSMLYNCVFQINELAKRLSCRLVSVFQGITSGGGQNAYRGS